MPCVNVYIKTWLAGHISLVVDRFSALSLVYLLCRFNYNIIFTVRIVLIICESIIIIFTHLFYWGLPLQCYKTCQICEIGSRCSVTSLIAIFTGEIIQVQVQSRSKTQEILCIVTLISCRCSIVIADCHTFSTFLSIHRSNRELPLLYYTGSLSFVLWEWIHVMMFWFLKN